MQIKTVTLCVKGKKTARKNTCYKTFLFSKENFREGKALQHALVGSTKPPVVFAGCSLRNIPLADFQSGSDNDRQEQRGLSAETIKDAL